MSRAVQTKPPHEILGIRPDSDLIEIAEAYGALTDRWQPEKNPGDELAALRFKRITDAFREMSAAQGFRPYEGNEPLPPIETPVFNTRGERIDHFNMRSRVIGLVCRFNDYLELNHHDIDDFKKEQGLRFTFLKAALRRREDDRAVYAAERQLRAAQTEALSEYGLRELKTLLTGFVMNVDAGHMDRILPEYLAKAETAIEERMGRFHSAMDVLKRAGKPATPVAP